MAQLPAHTGELCLLQSDTLSEFERQPICFGEINRRIPANSRTDPRAISKLVCKNHLD
jgi:hypothetical protein